VLSFLYSAVSRNSSSNSSVTVFAASAFITSITFCTSAFGQSWAAKMFETTTHDFGSVSRNAKTEFAFVLENIYEEELHIASVRSSCGCTKPVIGKSSLKTWEKSEITAQFNTRSFIGHKNAAITVTFDRPYYAEVQLLVKGHIRSDIVTEPGEVSFGEIESGTKRETPVRISYAGRGDWQIVDVRGKNDYLSVRMDPPQRRGNLVTYVLNVALSEKAPVGELHDELVVVTNDAVDNEFTLPLLGRVVPPITVAPALIGLGDVTAGQTKQQRFVVKGNKPFKIVDVTCPDSRFQFKPDVESKAVHVVPFEFVTATSEDEKQLGDFKQTVLVKTDLGEAFVAECTVSGKLIH
jgi:hypothetical protein